MTTRLTRRSAARLAGGLGAVGALGVPALAACAAPGSAPAAPQRSKAPFTLRLLQTFPTPESERWFNESLVPQYKEKVGSHASVSVSWVPFDKMEDHFGVQKVAGTLEDVIRTGAGPWVWIYAERQVGLPVDDRVRKWGKKDDFYGAAWDTLVWEGKTYGLITHTAPRMYPYRQDIVEESGARITDAWTWEDYMNAAVRMNRIQDGKLTRLGASPVTLNWQEFMLMFYSAGGKVTKNGKAAFDGPEGEWALELAVQRKARLQPAGTEPLPPATATNPLFASGLAGIVYGNMAQVRDVERFAPDRIGHVAVPPPPEKARRVSMVNSDGLTINRDTKLPDDAWDLLTLWCEPGPLEAWCEQSFSVPPRRSVAASAGFMKKPYLQKAATNLDKYGVPVPVWADYTNLSNLLQAELNAAVDQRKSAREALAAAARAWNPVLEQNKWKA